MYSRQHTYGILTGHLGQRCKILPICHIVKKQKNQEKLKPPMKPGD